MSPFDLARRLSEAERVDCPREPDVMFAGTGEGFIREEIRGTGLPLRGAGIFVTRDGGDSWRRLEQTVHGRIGAE